MTILLLCKGDERAKDLLRQAIIAHYGTNPAGYDTFHLVTHGKIRRTFGFIKLWLTLDLDIRFQSPNQVRQEYWLKLWKIPVLQETEVYDGEMYYLKTRNQPATRSTDQSAIESIQQRMWAYSALVLLPLSEMFVELAYADELSFVAHNTQTGFSATISLYENYQLKQIITHSTRNDAQFQMQLSLDSEITNDVTIFKALKVGWNHDIAYELYPSLIDFLDEFEEGTFQLS